MDEVESDKIVGKIIESLFDEDLEQIWWLRNAQNRASEYSRTEVIEQIKQALSLRQAKEER